MSTPALDRWEQAITKSDRIGAAFQRAQEVAASVEALKRVRIIDLERFTKLYHRVAALESAAQPAASDVESAMCSGCGHAFGYHGGWYGQCGFDGCDCASYHEADNPAPASAPEHDDRAMADPTLNIQLPKSIAIQLMDDELFGSRELGDMTYFTDAIRKALAEPANDAAVDVPFCANPRCGHPQGWHRKNTGSCIECDCTAFHDAAPASAPAHNDRAMFQALAAYLDYDSCIPRSYRDRLNELANGAGVQP